MARAHARQGGHPASHGSARGQRSSTRSLGAGGAGRSQRCGAGAQTEWTLGRTKESNVGAFVSFFFCGMGNRRFGKNLGWV